MRAWLQGREVVIAQGVDSMLHPAWRRGLQSEGPFLATARAYFERHGHASLTHATYGFPNRSALRIGAVRLDYGVISRGLPALFHNLQELRTADEFDDAPEPGRIVSEVTRYSEEIDDLWRRARNGLDLAIVRDSRYLNWRFADAPFDYRLWEVRAESGLSAIAVTRSNWCGQPILAIVEFLGLPGDAASLHAVLRHAVRRAYAERMHRVELWLPARSASFAAALAIGFASEPSGLTLAARVHGASPSFEWHRQNWHYTIGDSDIF